MSADEPTIGKITASRGLIFPWQRKAPPLWKKLLAVAFATTFFGIMMSVKVQVRPPEKLVAARKSVIFLDDSGAGRALALRAREGGPFPARFSLSRWHGLDDVEKAAIDAVRYLPTPYVPEVQELPAANQLQSLELAARGKSYFPPHPPVVNLIPDTHGVALAPVLHPLAGVTAAELPAELPPFDLAWQPPAGADPNKPYRRFLVQVDESGGVTECIPMDAGALEATGWLRRARFRTESVGGGPRWIAVGLAFTNQPVP